MGHYHTVHRTHRFQPDPVKGSRFIATVVPVSTPEQAVAELATIAAEMPAATHHCWAWRLRDGERSRSSDDGEPGGSAGRPILAQIQGHELFDVLVVVTRYYGGTKLGVGGLIRAYGGAAGQALDRSSLRVVEQTTPLTIHFAYSDTRAVQAICSAHNLTPLETAYETDVRMDLLVPVDHLEHIRDALRDGTAGRILINEPSKDT